MFSTACGEVIEAACQTLAVPASGPVLAHFHEWMCGGGLLYLKERAPKLGTVFTTHATHARPVDGGVRGSTSTSR